MKNLLFVFMLPKMGRKINYKASATLLVKFFSRKLFIALSKDKWTSLRRLVSVSSFALGQTSNTHFRRYPELNYEHWNPVFYFLIYELLENDHSIRNHKKGKEIRWAPPLAQVPESEAFQCGLCELCDDELTDAGAVTQPWRFTLMLKRVKQSSMPKAIFDKLLCNPFLFKMF